MANSKYIQDEGFRNWLILFNPPRKLKKRLKLQLIYYLNLPIDKRKLLVMRFKNSGKTKIPKSWQ